MRKIHFPKESYLKSYKLDMNMRMSMLVSVGDTVETRSEEDGFSGAYYLAKIIAKKGREKLLIEYKTLVTEADQTQFLREVIEARMVRPLPPSPESESQTAEFKILEKVDAYDNDGWWEGRIVGKKLLGGVGNNSDSLFSVYFDTTGDLIDYPINRLRPHQDYVNGVWIRSVTENCSVFMDMKKKM